VDKIGRGRVSLRKRNGKFQLYVRWFAEQDEEIIKETESLEEMIKFTNKLFGLNDYVVKLCKCCGFPISKDINVLARGEGILEEYKDGYCLDCYLREVKK